MFIYVYLDIICVYMINYIYIYVYVHIWMYRCVIYVWYIIDISWYVMIHHGVSICLQINGSKDLPKHDDGSETERFSWGQIIAIIT